MEEKNSTYVIKHSFIVQDKWLRHEKSCMVFVKEKWRCHEKYFALVYIFGGIYSFVYVHMLVIYVCLYFLWRIWYLYNWSNIRLDITDIYSHCNRTHSYGDSSVFNVYKVHTGLWMGFLVYKLNYLGSLLYPPLYNTYQF